MALIFKARAGRIVLLVAFMTVALLALPLFVDLKIAGIEISSQITKDRANLDKRAVPQGISAGVVQKLGDAPEWTMTRSLRIGGYAYEIFFGGIGMR